VTGRRTDSALRLSAYVVAAVVVLLESLTPAVGSGLAGLPGVLERPYEPLELIGGVVWCVAGLLVITSRPRNPIGWLLLVVPMLGSIQNVTGSYGTRAFARPGDGLPLGPLALSIGSSLWVAALFIPVTVLLVRYPSGALSSPRWRWADRAAVGAMALIAVGLATAQDSVDDWVVGARPVVAVPDAVSGGLLLIAGPVLVVTAVVVIGHAIVRTARARGPERAQLLLLLLTGAAAALAAFFSPWPELFSISLFFVPIAIAVGVLRYGLFGIELVVRRTLLYGSLTLLVALLYAAVVALASVATPTGPAPAVIGAAIVAVGLLPVRQRLQVLVDIVVYGERRDPLVAVTRFGTDLPDKDPLPAVVAAVARALGSPYVAVVATDGDVRAASAMVAPEGVLRLPLRQGDVELGTLAVAPRRGEHGLDPTDRRLLEAMTAQVTAVVRAVDLSEELAAAREHTVAAALSERRRLRHDLHDGLGPSLTGIGLGLEAVQAAIPQDPERAGSVVRRVRAEVTRAVDEIRRILDGLRPSALDEVGLVAALRERANDLTERSGGRLTVEIQAPSPMPTLDPETEVAAYRISEEALTNSVRHSNASTVVVRLRVIDDGISVEVSDDGRGFSPALRRGVGLDSMQQRAESLGGSLAVTADAGVRVLAHLPLAVDG
jgi:signal transduction histidine kinase